MSERIAIFLTAVWLAGSLFLAFVATENFATVDRVLAAPPADAARMIGSLGRQDGRLLLRYLAGEENRRYFHDWEIVELAITTVLAVLCWRWIRSRLLGVSATAALVLTAAQHFWITPELVDEGIAIAFSTAPDRLANFGRLHAIYGVIELLNLALATLIAGILVRGRRTQRRVSKGDPSEVLVQHATSPESFLHQRQ